jgi:RNA polymerase sigma factor (sigma-70 family)
MATGQPPEGAGQPMVDRADEQVTQLFRDHYEHFYGLVRKKGCSEADSHDILNNSGLALYKHLVGKGPIKGNLVAYFTRVVQNQTKEHNRRREPVDLAGDEILGALAAPVPPEAVTYVSPEKREMLKAASAALDSLPPYMREPYELAVLGRMEPAEIARMLNVPPGRIRSYLSVARAFIRESVGGRAEDDE